MRRAENPPAAAALRRGVTLFITIAAGLLVLALPGRAQALNFDNEGGVFVVGEGFHAAKFADLTEDGFPDAIVGGFVANEIQVAPGDGAGGFAAARTPEAVGPRTEQILVADVDEDDHLDVIAGGRDDVLLLLGDGDGGLAPAPGGPIEPPSGFGELSGVAAGDVDGDSHIDLMMISNDRLVTLIGDGLGGFTNGPESPHPFGSGFGFEVRFQLTDLDDDDDLDALVFSDSDGLQVMRNDSSGAFIRGQRVIGIDHFYFGEGLLDFTADDFDDDGDTDIAVSGFVTLKDAGIVTFRGRDDATFRLVKRKGRPVRPAQAPYATGSSLGSGDANGDGTQDLLLGGLDDFQTGTFPPPPRGALGVMHLNERGRFDVASGSPFDAGVGEFVEPTMTNLDGDADEELAAVDSFGGAAVSLERAGGSEFDLSGHRLFHGAAPKPSDVALGDFTGDGRLDLATANFGNDSVSIVENDGAGNFPELGASFPVAEGPSGRRRPAAMATGLVDGDAHLDVLTANTRDGTVSLLLGDGTGALTSAVGSPFPAGPAPTRLALADLGGTSALDVAVASEDDKRVTVLLGDGSGSLSPAPGVRQRSGGIPRAIAAGDVNGDGDADLVTANRRPPNERGPIGVLLGDGTGAFTQAPGMRPRGPLVPEDLVLADLNDDNDLDVAVTDAAGAAPDLGGATAVFFGDGIGGFAPAAGGPLHGGEDGLEVADVDLDSDPDLVAANARNLAGGSVDVFLNDGVGGFAPAPGGFGGRFFGNLPNEMAVGDLDGDDRPDIVTVETIPPSWAFGLIYRNVDEPPPDP